MIEQHPLASSCALYRLALTTVNGRLPAAVFKDLSPRARHRCPPLLLDPQREIDAYHVLREHPHVVAPRLLGSHADPAQGRYWIVLEEVDGVPLWQAEDPGAWPAAAAWLSSLHRVRPAGRASWLVYDRAYYSSWMDRALRLAPSAELEGLRATYRWAIERLERAPRSFIHGDFYPSNVLACNGSERVCVVDFELAGLGPVAIDLAALLTGLRRSEADALLDAYADAAMRPLDSRLELDELLLCARLHLAIRWLGWLPDWEAPPHQSFDWVGEAHSAAAALGMPR